MIQKIVDLLNEASQLAPDAIRRLILIRVPCNEAIERHPSIVVGGPAGKPTLGVLGLLNGLCESDERIVATVDDDDESKPVTFERGTPSTYPAYFS